MSGIDGDGIDTADDGGEGNEGNDDGVVTELEGGSGNFDCNPVL
jgi:hypothetical protein